MGPSSTQMNAYEYTTVIVFHVLHSGAKKMHEFMCELKDKSVDSQKMQKNNSMKII